MFRGFETTFAARLNNVKTTMHGELLDHPLTSRHKGLVVLSYSTPARNWQFDFTTQLNGKSRLPRTDYRQSDPILAWQDPFSPYFDSSLVWGPTVGRRIYLGIRLN